jgi:hypothetical protein
MSFGFSLKPKVPITQFRPLELNLLSPKLMSKPIGIESMSPILYLIPKTIGIKS